MEHPEKGVVFFVTTVVALVLFISVAGTGGSDMSKRVSVTVGQKDADIVGSDNRALQADRGRN